MTKSLSVVAWSPKQWSREEQEGGISFRLVETFGHDEGSDFLDMGSGFMVVYLCQELSKLTFKYVQFIICQLYLDKAVQKNLPGHSCFIQGVERLLIAAYEAIKR